MKLIAGIDHALAFEQLANEKEAAAYRKLAAKRAGELGLEPPKNSK
jgi:hypothetical protein